MEILKEIEEIMKTNENIITRITTKTDVNVCSWEVEYRGTSFVLTDKKLTKPASEIIQTWTPTAAAITSIDDLFNDKLEYTCKCFDDVKRLNNGMWSIAKKYRLFGESEAALSELTIFKRNYHSLGECLVKLEGLLSDKPLSTIVPSKVQIINNYLAEMQSLSNVLLVASTNGGGVVSGNTGVSGVNITGVIQCGSIGSTTGGSTVGGTTGGSTAGSGTTGGSTVDGTTGGSTVGGSFCTGGSTTSVENVSTGIDSTDSSGNSGVISPSINIPTSKSPNNNNINNNSLSTSPNNSPSTVVKKKLKKKPIVSPSGSHSLNVFGDIV